MQLDLKGNHYVKFENTEVYLASYPKLDNLTNIITIKINVHLLMEISVLLSAE